MRAAIVLFALVALVGTYMSRSIDVFLPAKPGKPSAAAATSGAAPAQPPQQTSAGRTVTLRGDGRGHFQVEARVDGRRLEALVDTGASLVVLNESSANRLGIFPRVSDYTGLSNTANGVAKFAPVRLNRVELNGITVYDVEAAVMPDSALRTNLLGMSFLSRVKFTHDKGRMVLEQ